MNELREILRRYWGYDDFRPLQAEAMRAVVEGRDSLVVLPTGGGKSLCFQAPALAMPGLAVVVSPLIALMKDQVDALVDCGVPAACVNSTLTFDERRRIAEEIRAERLKLLYLSPERLLTERTLEFLQGVPLSFIAVDEAHCISEWGHDFRPEYRGLRLLKEKFPNVALHAYTATATPHVRDDIVRELRLAEPEILVGSFDRPNLVYRARGAANLLQQIREVDRSPSERFGPHLLHPPDRRRGNRGPVGRSRLQCPALSCRACRTMTAGTTRRRSSTTARRSSWPPWPSAWASTNRTCGM